MKPGEEISVEPVVEVDTRSGPLQADPESGSGKRSWRIDEREHRYLKELLAGGFPGGSETNFVGRFEEAFAAVFGSRYAITFVNGTATLHAGLAAAGIGRGDEVVVPPLTMASTSLAVLHQGATPVFADVDPHTFNIDPESVRQRITGKTRAVIPVALYGLSPDMDPLMALAREHDLAVIEDAAQCFLGRYHGKLVGAMGHVGSFSFQNSKHMTCGEGGVVVTSDERYAEEMRRFSSLGYGLVGADPGASRIEKRDLVRPDFERHVSLGFNYRLSEFCAAVLLGQLEKLEDFVERRRRCAAAFRDAVAGCAWVVPQDVPAGYDHAYWCYAVRLDVNGDKAMWQRFYDRFVELGGDGFYGAWALTYREPLFRRMFADRDPPGTCPVAEGVQPFLVQLKTHYGDPATALHQAEILAETIRWFDGR